MPYSVPRIADFGLAVITDMEDDGNFVANMQCGSRMWHAPVCTSTAPSDLS